MLLAVIVASCAAPEPPADSSQSLDLVKLEQLFEQDCKCRLAGINNSEFGKEFERLTKNMEQMGYATSSFPASYEGVCFPELGETACISTGGYLPPSSDNFFCSLAQGLELEASWNSVEGKGQGSVTEADIKMLEQLEKIREDASEPSTRANCKKEN